MNLLKKHSPAHIKQTAVLLMTLLIISACSKEVSNTTSAEMYHQSAALTTIFPTDNYHIKRSYLGQVAAKQNSALSFEYAGKISNVLVDNGDIVKKGQQLAQQDIVLLSYKTAELQAQIAQSQAQITLNQANLRRIKTLISNGYSSKQRLDELNAENKIIKAQISGLNARIQTLAYQKEKSGLVAPFNGVITKRLISVGQVISAGSPSFHIIESANNEITVGIPSKIASTLTLGQLIDIAVNNQNKSAKLIAIGQQIDTVNRTVQLRLKMLESLEQSKNFNGQLVKVAITQQVDKAGFWLPINAITDGVRGQWQIFIASVLSPNKKNNYLLKATTVNVLHANEHSVYISGLALKPHTIVAQGVHRYVAGQVITTSTKTLTNTAGNH
ncbi:MAG: efflux RND transporter periplasmic adaptor subunit [Colwellia sp.]|nr:efflux RND transporter periplasmic adaptor subunit [Colwellia sp.]